jgi:hypothetical protein
MSRGLGKLQREILETLEAARPACGCPDGVYDLWNSSRFLAKRHGAGAAEGDYCAHIKPAFQSAFSHAVRGLMARGLLYLKDEEKVVRPPRYVMGRWSPGQVFYRYRSKRVRYVTVSESGKRYVVLRARAEDNGYERASTPSPNHRAYGGTP